MFLYRLIGKVLKINDVKNLFDSLPKFESNVVLYCYFFFISLFLLYHLKSIDVVL